MGVFNLLCSCCLGRSKKCKESLVEYSYVPYGPSANEVADTSTKEKFVDSVQPAKETTPPPNYSVNSLSKVQTIVSSAPINANSVPSSTEIKEENSEIAPRAIKPLPQRRDKRRIAAEQKSLLQTPLPPSLYKGLEEPVAQQVSDKKDGGASSSKPVQLFVFPNPNVNIEKNAAIASSSTETTTTTGTTATATAAASMALVANSAETTTIFDRLAARNSASVPTPTPVIPTPVTPTPVTSTPVTSTPITPTPVSNPAPVPDATPTSDPAPIPAPIPAPAPAPENSDRFLTLPLRPAPHTPNTTTNTVVPLPTINTLVPRPAPLTITTPPQPQPTPSSSNTTSPGRFCPKCHSKNTPLTTRSHNLNHLRPYRLCSNTACGSWNGFTDTRGLDARQQCECSPSYPMRLVAMNKTDEWGRHKAFWSCQYKACDAWGVCVDDAGLDRWFGRDELEVMVKEGRI